MADRKIFAGPRIKRIRRDLGLSQTRMAEELGISGSYLNLIERDQRPLTAQLLLRLAETYDIDLKALAGDEEQLVMAELREVFADPLFAGSEILQQEIRDVAAASPVLSQGVARLFRAYQEAMSGATAMAERLADRDQEVTPSLGGGTLHLPVEEVRDHFHAKRNHFPELDERAEDLYDAIHKEGDDPYTALRQYLKEKHDVSVAIMPVDVMAASLRRYDRHRKRIQLSERLGYAARIFQLANRIISLECAELLDQEVAASGLEAEGAAPLFRLGLSNYGAAALVMPYGKFLETAKNLRYDVESLCDRFSASFEQVCHRLTTLQRPGARGIPFFLIRVDCAGNVSKRFSAGGFHFARSGGTCPRWNVHEAFRTPGQIYTQIIQLPDETAYFSIAKAVERVGGDPKIPNQTFAVGLGCELSHASRISYAQAYDLDDPAQATPIGVTCRLCERMDCTQRAFPPLRRTLTVHDHVRGVSPFTFVGND